MIFADKLVQLRKKNGWSQEELADQMNVSRQTVSKWEGAQSIPDLAKVLTLSKLFGVTTDYLLKDEIELEEYASEDTPKLRQVSMEEAHRYLDCRRSTGNKFALCCALCILCPIPLFFLSPLGEAPYSMLSENIAIGLGLIGMGLLLAAAIIGFVLQHFKTSPFDYLEKEPFETEYGVRGMVLEQKKQYQPIYKKSLVVAISFYVLSAFPLLSCSFFTGDFFACAMTSLCLLFVAIGSYFLISASRPKAGMDLLLKEGPYAPDKDGKNKAISTLTTVYWTLVVFVYLVLALPTNNWGGTWYIWPLAGLLYGAIYAVADWLISKNK